MANSDTNLADRSGALIESQKGYDPRVRFFYFVIALLLTIVGCGLGYEQIVQFDTHSGNEQRQNRRRIVVPGPRGEIFDRNGNVLIGNQPRLSAVLYLDELRPELRAEAKQMGRNYLAAGVELPSGDQVTRIVRTNVVQRYLDQVNAILGRDDKVDSDALTRHFSSELLLPFTLIEDLSQADYARLTEHLPVDSPLQVYASSKRYYPYGSTAAHALGRLKLDPNVEIDEFPGGDLKTFKMTGTVGIDGLERQFNDQLQGQAGGRIIRVDPLGYRTKESIAERKPVQGKSLTTSLDIDLQLVAEEAIGDQTGAAVALDVKTGEVLVLASKPDYDLNAVSPRMSTATFNTIQEQGAWQNLAVNGLYPPGSTFKLLVSIAGLRSGSITPNLAIADCDGVVMIGGRRFFCDNGEAHHGKLLLPEAIARSCDIYFYEAGRLTTVDVIAAEARRFHLDRRTGIELPYETAKMVIPDTTWKQREWKQGWFAGDTANMSIGQGYVLVTPLEMASFVASVARNEVSTTPTLLHNPNAAAQHSESIGLSTQQRAALIEGMEGVVKYGTASLLSSPAFPYPVPGVRIAGKTGTAQVRTVKDDKLGTINCAWFICFAPVEDPQIAIAVMLEGDTLGETFGGGRNAAPVASRILKKYFEKKNQPVVP